MYDIQDIWQIIDNWMIIYTFNDYINLSAIAQNFFVFMHKCNINFRDICIILLRLWLLK